MKPELWNRAKQILPEARELPPEERAAFLDEACEGDAELRREVESFLATDPAALTFMEKPPIRLLEEDETALRKDSQVGAYRILRRLGSGGMGIVYLATRVGDEFRREVAIKVLLESQVGQASGETERRFLQEMGILAKLNHPNIAKLHEGGRTEDGRLYYLMEYVEGEPIDVYCREEKLSLEQRLRLFQKVAAAVQYAHTRLVIHRDIKPSNVLVTAEGEPKLLDFGVAKPLEGAGLGATVLTGGDQKLFTPDYASPEQIAGQDIHIASDVYSLGILLYELLAGDRPYRLKGLAEQESRRKVCDETPPPPSTVTARAATTKTASEPPATDPTTASFGRHLQGDLDTIVLMALRKSPQERYATVQQLADDIERNLLGHPIQARTPSIGYRARKFVKRNRVGLGVAGLFLILAVVAAGALYNQYRETVQERDRAEAVSEFLTDIFSHSDPQTRNTPDTTARELLEQAVQKIEHRPELAPETKANLLVSLGAAYLNLGLYDQASNLLTTAVELSREHAPGSEVLGDSLQALGVLKLQAGDPEQAEQLLSEAVDLRRKILEPTSEKLASSLNGLGLLYKRNGNYDKAERSYREAIAIRRHNQEDRLGFARSLQNLAALMRTLDRYPEAEQLYLEAIEIKVNEVGADHPSTATSIQNLGLLYKNQGKYEEAKKQYLRAIEINRNSLGELSPQVAMGLDNLGVLLLQIGELDEAEGFLREALRIRQQVLEPTHPDVARSLHNLGALKYTAGDLSEAESLYREAAEVTQGTYGPEHTQTLRYQSSLAVALEMHGELREAEQILLSSLHALEAKEPVERREVANIKEKLATVLAKTDRLDEAENYAREASIEFQTLLGVEHPDVADAESVLGGVLLLRGRLSEAEPLLRSSYETLLQTRGSDAAATVEALERLQAFERRLEGE